MRNVLVRQVESALDYVRGRFRDLSDSIYGQFLRHNFGRVFTPAALSAGAEGRDAETSSSDHAQTDKAAC